MIVKLIEVSSIDVDPAGFSDAVLQLLAQRPPWKEVVMLLIPRPTFMVGTARFVTLVSPIETTSLDERETALREIKAAAAHHAAVASAFITEDAVCIDRAGYLTELWQRVGDDWVEAACFTATGEQIGYVRES